jgi:integrative and conjugative element protein (TIGR02256 family)
MARWLDNVTEICSPESMVLRRAVELIAFTEAHGSEFGVRLVEARKKGFQYEIIIVEVDVERPQVLAFDIKRREQIGIVIQHDDRFFSTFSNREDFPFTPHQNAVPDGVTASLCIDDRPWAEARLTWTPADCIRRVREWLRKAARGELNDPAQPLEPFFYSANTILVIPRSILFGDATGEPVRLLGHLKQDGTSSVVVTTPANGTFKEDNVKGRIAVIPFALSKQEMAGIHGLPSTLDALAIFLRRFELDLLSELRKRIIAWASWKGPDFDFLSARIAVCIVSSVADADRSMISARAFMTIDQSAGDVGVAIGCLHAGQPDEIGKGKKFVAAVPQDSTKTGADVQIEPMNVHMDFDRILAAEISGTDVADERKVVMVGAGAIGSHIAMTFAREGAFRWTVVDDDVVLPHNLARHTLHRFHLGYSKAIALAHQIRAILSDEQAAKAIPTNCLTPELRDASALAASYQDADIILDTSASIAVARHLSDVASNARRISAFFNPAGTSAILLSESSERHIPLREIEAQYYGLLLTEPDLKRHLTEGPEGLRYSGSCRTLTSRIPERSAAVLSALAAGGIRRELELGDGGIRIWAQGSDGSVQAHHFPLVPGERGSVREWAVTVDGRMTERLQGERAKHLPNETGGVLLGVVDYAKRSIHVVHALGAPPDSQETHAGFERGVEGLLAEIEDACRTVAHQIRYVGEWHSHPRGASSTPSSTDVRQIAWLVANLRPEGAPAVMLIVGGSGISINLGLVDEGQSGE